MNSIQSLPSRSEILENPEGFPKSLAVPKMQPQKGYQNVLYHPSLVTTDWEGHRSHLALTRPDLKPRVVLVGHDMSEIENLTLMCLGGLVKSLNGSPSYLLTGPDNMAVTADFLMERQAEWLGISLYTGLTNYVFNWLVPYKLDRARSISKKNFSDFESADRYLKGLVREAKGPVYSGNELLYAPVIIGGHYNNFNYAESLKRGGDYVIRGKGVNLFRDILLGLVTEPGIYHDPMPYANLPQMDREGFYRDTFEFSDKTKKYALSQIKSVVTALGCAYRCTYCYISSLIDNLAEAYQGSGIAPPSIIQDRTLQTVVKEGLDILRLDEKYGVRTTAVFDQADISLNNMEWWNHLSQEWVQKVGIPFYIQARPAMLSGEKGWERISHLSRSGLLAGISMAIESGDPSVRRLLLKRNEPNKVIVDAIQNVKRAQIPLRTQSIVALPVMRPERPVNPSKSGLSLVDIDGSEHYYEDPIQESLKCLDLVCSANAFGKEDYYWTSLYSPFPGTPLGDYSVAAGFADEDTDSRAYQFTMDSGLNCYTGLTLQRQIAFSRTSNFFSHFTNGKDLMVLFLYGNTDFSLEGFARFTDQKASHFRTNNRPTRFGLCPVISSELLEQFFAHAYGDDSDKDFRETNRQLIPYYMHVLDGLVLAAKVAVKYHELKRDGKKFEITHLHRVERTHYYDNSYNMAYAPEAYAAFLQPYIHDARSPQRFSIGRGALARDAYADTKNQ